jgi:hypothetical protein
MNNIRLIFIAFLISMSNLVISGEEHHNLTVDTCRAFPTGNLQIRGESATDNADRHITYTTQMFSEKILDRYFSACLTALSTGYVLRVDYLECTGTTCVPKSNTTSIIFK